jgi:hypothetical protein
MTKSRLLALSAAFVLSLGAGQAQQGAKAPAAAKPQDITVWRTATCGCCGKWVEHLKTSGFNPTVHVVQNTDEVPAAKGVPRELRSCHTATVNGYTVEGHVPADVIQKLLKEKPKVAGIAVPGMPAGSPGMESPTPQPYDIVAFDAAGKTKVFASRGPKKQ